LNETATRINTEVISRQLHQTLNRLRPTSSRLQQSEPVGRLVTEIVFVGDQKIQALNAQFRGINAPTDVLSFDRNDTNPDLPASIVISVETATRQAQAAGWVLDQELSALANHGFLHILGYSHA